MPQEFHAVRCFKCECFQVQIVKKTNKWECKMCGAIQSLIQVFGNGSSKDCRIIVQKLNELRFIKNENFAQNDCNVTNDIINDKSENLNNSFANVITGDNNKWNKFFNNPSSPINLNSKRKIESDDYECKKKYLNVSKNISNRESSSSINNIMMNSFNNSGKRKIESDNCGLENKRLNVSKNEESAETNDSLSLPSSDFMFSDSKVLWGEYVKKTDSIIFYNRQKNNLIQNNSKSCNVQEKKIDAPQKASIFDMSANNENLDQVLDF